MKDKNEEIFLMRTRGKTMNSNYSDDKSFDLHYNSLIFEFKFHSFNFFKEMIKKEKQVKQKKIKYLEFQKPKIENY